MTKLIPGSLSEFTGAFALVFVGGAAVINCAGESIVVIALAHGLVLAATISALVHVSGAQFNPAVSIALVVLAKQSPGRALVYILAQLAGAVAGAAALVATYRPELREPVRLGATLGSMSLGDEASVLGVLALETGAAFLLMAVIIGTLVDERGMGKDGRMGGWGVGAVVGALVLAIGPQTGASMNPCRSFGPALVGGHWEMHWAYWLGPIAGASLASLVWIVFLGGTEVPGEASPVERGLRDTGA